MLACWYVIRTRCVSLGPGGLELSRADHDCIKLHRDFARIGIGWMRREGWTGDVACAHAQLTAVVPHARYIRSLHIPVPSTMDILFCRLAADVKNRRVVSGLIPSCLHGRDTCSASLAGRKGRHRRRGLFVLVALGQMMHPPPPHGETWPAAGSTFHQHLETNRAKPAMRVKGLQGRPN